MNPGINIGGVIIGGMLLCYCGGFAAFGLAKGRLLTRGGRISRTEKPGLFHAVLTGYGVCALLGAFVVLRALRIV